MASLPDDRGFAALKPASLFIGHVCAKCRTRFKAGDRIVLPPWPDRNGGPPTLGSLEDGGPPTLGSLEDRLEHADCNDPRGATRHC